ncbi:autotransporter [Dyella jiangningensis]|jgi:OOP family OmpA-OmpF porin|uniref:porin family protein n=1 Tax=Dyella jiangningensis TaxID=1379159 RepID=UPI0004563D8E|nr:porin family protein [Dyella jiangningensis]AHX11991.1 autotransporter [Dyella jiangningensis]AHX15937.1 autotransporter [Dyella jiangningensis]MDG2539356.1 porin family protein [Dyella jiangningensis]
MKKTLLAIAIATTGFIAAPAFAQDTSSSTSTAANGNYQPYQPVGSGNWFINGSVGEGHVANGPYNDHPTTYGINGGYRWKVGQDMGLGVEVGYNDQGNYKLKNIFNSQPVNQTNEKNDLRGWTAGVNGKINVWDGLYVSGRAGIYGWKGHGYDNNSINRHHLDDVSWYGGAGVGYDFNQHFSLGVSYDYFDAKKQGVDLSTDTASVTAEYRF